MPAPRYYGALPPGPAFVLGCVLLVAALVAFVVGSMVLGIVLLVIAALAFAFFYGAARRSPASPVAHGVFATANHVRGWAAFTWQAASAWARALRDVVRLRGDAHRLRRQREPLLRSLGEAAYAEDAAGVSALRERLRQIDDDLAKRELAEAETLARARQRVDDEHAAVQATQRLSVDEISSARKTD